jgi:hypothetical protein
MPKRSPRPTEEQAFAPRMEALRPPARAIADDPLERLPAPRGMEPKSQPERIHKTFVLFRDTAEILAEQASHYRLGIGEFTDFLLRSALAAVADGTLEVPTHAVPFQPPNYRQGGTRRLPARKFGGAVNDRAAQPAEETLP